MALTSDAAITPESHVMKDSMDDNEGVEKHCWSSLVFQLLRWYASCPSVGLYEGFVVGTLVVHVTFMLFVLHLRKLKSM